MHVFEKIELHVARKHTKREYRIAGKLSREKLSRIGRKGAFHGENFRGM
jgi:predicted DNA binding CopG/RHH family protein